MRTVATGVAVLITVVAATTPRLVEAADPQSERIAAVQGALDAWYTCIECQDGELDKLIRYRDLVEETLIVTLRDGPSPARKTQVEELLRESYQSSPSQTISEDRYVELFMANADAKFRTRAALALGKIRTPNAVKALKEAEGNKNLREDVRMAAREARTGRRVNRAACLSIG